MVEEVFEYELIDIDFSFDFSQIENTPRIVADLNDFEFAAAAPIEYDENNIPMGNSKAEMKMREKIIKDFYGQWIAGNPSKKIWNDALQAEIHVKFKSINETANKAARSYESTIAVFSLTEILQTAIKVKIEAKKNNNNQREFENMIIMRALERVKVVVGLQKTTKEFVQYSITVPKQQKSSPRER